MEKDIEIAIMPIKMAQMVKTVAQTTEITVFNILMKTYRV